MARIKNVSGLALHPMGELNGRLVQPEEIVEVSDDAAYGYTCQESNWQPTDAAGKKAHDKGAKAERALLKEQVPTPEPEPEAADDTTSKENI